MTLRPNPRVLLSGNEKAVFGGQLLVNSLGSELIIRIHLRKLKQLKILVIPSQLILLD